MDSMWWRPADIWELYQDRNEWSRMDRVIEELVDIMADWPEWEGDCCDGQCKRKRN